ncbi:DUF192 domain-containing protein, partial [Candidatus Micrarchaeota archaeon]|nr:DUF192 domain-containing protein [Candidatus Micrarchaeota archaeon]
MPALINKKTKKIIAQKVMLARTAFARAKGLMFERAGNFDYALVFELRGETRMGASVHMMFVFFPIDVVYLNKHREVVDVCSGLKPWALNYTPKSAAKYFIELPAGTAGAKGILTGDRAFAWYEKQRRGLGFDFLDSIEMYINNISA